MKKDTDELLNSNYDGIQEYDNSLPTWWRMLFYLTILYAIVYCGYYLVGPGPSSDQELSEKMAAIRSQQAASAPRENTEIDLVSYVKDSSHISKGKAVYDARCMACHGNLGQGVIGPNLTDSYWIHGGTVAEIKKTIENGVLDKGMLAWKGVLSNDEINDVVSYVHSLWGTKPPGAKEAQGTLVELHE